MRHRQRARATPAALFFPVFSWKSRGKTGGRPQSARRASARKRRDANGKSARAASRGSPDLAADNRKEQDENREKPQPCFAKHSTRAIVNAFHCALVSRAQRSMKRSGMMRCRHRSRVYPRSALRCAQVGQARLAWTVPVRGGPGSALHRSTSLRAAPRPGHAIAPDARRQRPMPSNDECRASHRTAC